MINIKLSSFSEPDTNGIFKDEDAVTTQEIQRLINANRRVIVVTEPRAKHVYTNIIDLNSNSIYEIISENKLVEKICLSIDKFLFLIKFGKIDAQKYQLVMLRLDELKKPLANAFKHFFLEEQKERFDIVRKIRVNCYFKNINVNDAMFIGSRNREFSNSAFFGSGNEKILCQKPAIFSEPEVQEECKFCETDPHFEKIEKNAIFSLFITEPAFSPLIDNYLSAKFKLQRQIEAKNCDELKAVLKKANEVEKISFKYALKIIKPSIGGEGRVSEDIRRNFEDDYIKKLLADQMKYEKLKSLILSVKDKIFVVTSSPILVWSFGAQSEQLIDACNCDSAVFTEKAETSILLFYEEKSEYLAKYNFKQIVIFKEKEKDFSFFFSVRDIRRSVNADCNFLKFVRENEPMLKQGLAHITVSSAYQMLVNFFYVLKNVFDENFLYIKDIKIKNSYMQTGNDFVCVIELPRLHDHTIFNTSFKSKPAPSKKIAQNELSMEIFRSLLANGFCNEFFLPSKIFIDNNLVYDSYLLEIYGTNEQNEIKKIREDFFAEKMKNNLVYENNLDSLFSKEYPVFLKNHSEDLKERSNRMNASSLSKYTKTFSVYVFNPGYEEDWDIGICCSAAFSESIIMDGVKIENKKEGVFLNGIKIKYLFDCEFTSEQIDLIFFFQVIFFSLHFKNTASNDGSSKSYCYFAVPIKNGSINFELLTEISTNFLKENVYAQENDNFKNCLLFNPVSRFFYTYFKEMHNSINDKIVNSREGCISYADFFEEKYNVILSIVSDDTKLLFKGLVYTGKPTSTAATVLSAEIVYVTSVPKDLYRKHFIFSSLFPVFEHACIAYDLKNALNLNIPVCSLMACICAKRGNPDFDDKHCYERYEFLGDAILKFVAAKHLFLSKMATLNEMVSKKDGIVSNENLCKIAYRLDIPKYFSSVCFSEKCFQPPNLNRYTDSVEDSATLIEYINYFKAEKVFSCNKGDKIVLPPKKEQNEEIQVRKVFADVMEAIIGQYYLNNGFQAATDFIYDISIMPRIKFVPPTYKLYNLVSETEMKEVEEKIGYVFKNKALLERIIVHPCRPTQINPEDFQILEMLGDSLLDFLVTPHIFKNYPHFDPYYLHEKRKSLVNNFSLARMLFELELDKNIRHCFSADYIESVKSKITDDGSKVNKMFGDVIEAVFGAVYVDCGFDIDMFLEFGKSHLDVLEKCRDCTR